MKVRAASFTLALLVPAAPAHAQWALSPRPTMTIGSEASLEYQFNNIVNLRRLSDGRIVVTTGPDIRFFDRNGRYLARAGGRGRGPGEFQYVSALLVMPGDSLMTMNVRTIVVLDPDGKFVRQSQPDFQPLSGGDWFTEGSVLLPNGNLLSPQYSRRESNTPSSTVHRPTMRYSILDLRSGIVVPLHTGGGLAQLHPNGERWSAVVPFTPNELYAIGTDRVYVGDNDSTIIHAFDLAGKPLGNITVPDRPTPVTAADLEAEKLQELEWAARNRTSKEEFERRWAATPKPTRHPYWGAALVDKAGVLWVSAPPRTGEAPIAWTAFDRNGKRLATLTVPPRFTPRDIGPDYVLGVQRDEDGVETVALYSLRRN